jgi:hypothetical protein
MGGENESEVGHSPSALNQYGEIQPGQKPGVSITAFEIRDGDRVYHPAQSRG